MMKAKNKTVVDFLESIGIHSYTISSGRFNMEITFEFMNDTFSVPVTKDISEFIDSFNTVYRERMLGQIEYHEAVIDSLKYKIENFKEFFEKININS